MPPNGTSPHKQGIESIDQIAGLCQSDLEAVRAAAREATLSFGEVTHPTSCAVRWGSRVLSEAELEPPRPALQRHDLAHKMGSEQSVELHLVKAGFLHGSGGRKHYFLHVSRDWKQMQGM